MKLSSFLHHPHQDAWKMTQTERLPACARAALTMSSAEGTAVCAQAAAARAAVRRESRTFMTRFSRSGVCGARPDPDKSICRLEGGRC